MRENEQISLLPIVAGVDDEHGTPPRRRCCIIIGSDVDNSLVAPTNKIDPVAPNLRFPLCPATVFEGCAVLVESLLTHSVFHNPLCGLVFRCGCTFDPWLGGTGWLLCNVHNPNNYSPRCPWCVSPRDTPAWTWTTGKTIIVSGMMVAWAMARWRLSATSTVAASRQRKWRWQLQSRSNINSCAALICRAVIAPLTYFFLYHVLTGLVWCLATGYPYWFGFTFPNHQRPTAPLPPVLPNPAQ